MTENFIISLEAISRIRLSEKFLEHENFMNARKMLFGYIFFSFSKKSRSLYIL